MLKNLQKKIFRLEYNLLHNSRIIYFILSFILIIAAVVFTYVCYPTTIGNFWWDWISLLGAGKAISQGLMPFRDFWTTLFYPLIELHIIIDVFGVDRAFLITHLVHLILSIAFLSCLVFGLFSIVECVILLLGVSIMSFIPVNFSHMAGGVVPSYIPEIGIPNYNAHYNRFNDALLLIAYVGFYPNNLISRAYRIFLISNKNMMFFYNRGFVLALLALILFLSKITVFFVFLGLFICRFFISSKNIFLTVENIIIISLFVVVIFLVEFRYGIISEYLNITNQIARIKSERMFQEFLVIRLPWILDFHGIELVCIIINLVFLFYFGFIKYNFSKYPVYYNKKNFYANFFIFINSMLIPIYNFIFISGCMLITTTNYGDYGLFPINLALIVSLNKLFREEVCMNKYYYATLISKIQITNIMKITTIIPLVLYFYFSFSSISQMIYNSLSGGLVPISTGVPYIDENFATTPKINEKLTNLDLASVKYNKSKYFFEPEYFTLQAYSYGSLYKVLNKYYPNKNREVEVLSLTSFLMSVISDYKIPKGAYSWLHINHEILPSSPPPLNKITGNASLIIVDLCDLNLSNRLGLALLFKDELKKSFMLKHETTCWQVYERYAPYIN